MHIDIQKLTAGLLSMTPSIETPRQKKIMVISTRGVGHGMENRIYSHNLQDSNRMQLHLARRTE